MEQDIMFIETFSIDPHVSLHIKDAQNLLERVVFLTNEYTTNYVNKRKVPLIRINMIKYNKGLLPLVEKMLDGRLPKKIRPYIKVEINNDKDMGSFNLRIKWNEAHHSLITSDQMKVQ